MTVYDGPYSRPGVIVCDGTHCSSGSRPSRTGPGVILCNGNYCGSSVTVRYGTYRRSGENAFDGTAG